MGLCRIQSASWIFEYALASSIVFVCRKRKENAGICTRRNFLNELKRELRLALKKLQDSNIAPVDLAQSAIGPGIAVFSKYKQVLEADGNPMIWDYTEANPFAGEEGSFNNALSRTCDTIALSPAGIDGITKVKDAAVPTKVKNAMIATSLPYYDRASYSDLSDFFYVWMKYGLQDLYPDYFGGDTSSKQEELTAFSHRFGGEKKKADAIYAEGLGIAMKSMYSSASGEYPSFIGYIYKGNDSSDGEELSEWE